MLRLCSLLLAATVAAGGARADEVPGTDTYEVAFDRSTARTRTDRVLSSISLSGSTVELTAPRLMYNDLTHKEFVVTAGQRVQPYFNFSGRWMQGYIYIDLNRNGRFDVEAPGPHGSLAEGNELVCFAGMNCADGAYDSAGNELADLSGVQPPSFVVPSSLEPGVYMMRWKVDWDSADPAGSMRDGNDIVRNGGAIVDVLLRVTEDEQAGSWQLVFDDEFDQPDGSAPDEGRWTASARGSSTWNRWVSDSPEVALVRDGSLLCRAIPNPDTASDTAPMLTGAVETRGKFAFTYGRVEVRLRTNLHNGNFPAAWMMPQPPAEGWPRAGEIDIFESIDGQNTAFHTVHSHWTYTLGHRSEPQSSFNEAVTVGQWHVYGLEWTDELITWTVDGRAVGTYARSTDEAVVEQGQWPFQHAFYLILNQSVGDGSWAKAADTGYTYETCFDYVRVYQHTPVGLRDIGYSRSAAGVQTLYDLSGRRVGTQLHKGIYVRDGHKFIVP